MAADQSTAEIKRAVVEYLRSKNIAPNTTWLSNFLSSIRTNTPIAALQQTALFRILSTDLTTTIQVSAAQVLPADISSPEVRERRLPGSITVQVLDIEDIGHSRWSQVETLEAQERGETTRGREIVRVVAEDDDASTPDTSRGSSGPHKLLLQDVAGTKAYAFDATSVPGLNIQQLSLGAKLVLKDVTTARGVALLEPSNVEVLGGRVEAWDTKWRKERKEMLKRRAGMVDAEVG